jgi:hypothetical protein
MGKKIVEILREVHAHERKYGWFIEPPASPQEIATLKERTHAELGNDLPEEYAAFLSVSNGLDWNGTVFYATERWTKTPERPFLEGVIDANLDFPDFEEFSRWLVLGESGMEMYVCDPGPQPFRVVDKVSLDVYEQFDSFEQLFAKVIRLTDEDAVRPGNERWKLDQCFGDDAVTAVLGPRDDAYALASDEQMADIAERSTVPYWTDGQRLYTIEGTGENVRGTRLITPVEALRTFGLDQVLDAREFGVSG